MAWNEDDPIPAEDWVDTREDAASALKIKEGTELAEYREQLRHSEESARNYGKYPNRER
jgi:hypothetical protein